MAVVVRPARPDEAEVLFAIHRESALAAYVDVFPPDLYPFPGEEMRRHWERELADPGTEVVVAELNGRPVGFATVSPGWLRNLFVVPEEWGRGAGPAVHDEAVRHLRTMGAGARLWVLEANERARRFYEARGWRPDGERGRSEFPPYPPTLRYGLELGAGSDPSQTPTHPGG